MRGAASQESTHHDRFARLRSEFPLLQREVHGRRLVYLDTAATSQKPRSVIEAEAAFYRNTNANAHRGLYALAAEATEAFETTRARVADWVGAATPEQVVVTRGTTSALNLAAHGWSHHLREGDEILLTEMEHHANLVPWIMVARRTGATLKHVPITPEGALDRDAYARLLGPRTRVVAFTFVSNVLGTVNPVAELAAMAREHDALVVLDAAQAVGHRPVDFEQLGVDLMGFSAHKVYGPMGLGFLVGRPSALEALEPTEGGGEMIRRVDLDDATWDDVPLRFEAGTQNVAAAAAFPDAIALLDSLGLRAVQHHEQALAAYAQEELARLGGIEVFGPPPGEDRGGLVSFYDARVHPHDLATLLDQRGVAIRAGHHCAQPLHRRLGVPSTARASFGVYSSAEDVDALVDGIRFARRYFAT